MFMKYLDEKRFSETGKHRRKYKGKRRFNYIKVKYPYNKEHHKKIRVK